MEHENQKNQHLHFLHHEIVNRCWHWEWRERWIEICMSNKNCLSDPPMNHGTNRNFICEIVIENFEMLLYCLFIQSEIYLDCTFWDIVHRFILCRGLSNTAPEPLLSISNKNAIMFVVKQNNNVSILILDGAVLHGLLGVN